MNQQSFDDIIKKKVGEYSAPVPADAWDNIMGGKKKRRVVFFWWVFGVLIAGGIAVGGYGVISKSKEMTDSEQTLISKDKGTVDIHQQSNKNIDDKASSSEQRIVSKSKEITDSEQTLISKDKGTADIHQQSDKNIDDKASSSEQKIVSKNNATGNVRQLLTNKDSEAGSVYQSIIDHHHKLTGKREKVDKNHQQSDKNIDDETISSEHELISNNTIHPALNTNSIDLQPIKTYYFQTLIDYSILHVPVDINRIKKVAKKSIWTIDFSITPFIPVQQNEALSYLQRTKITDNYQTIYTANETHTSEELSFAYSFAIRRKINKKLELGTGLQYSRIREKVWLSGKEINTTFSVIQRLHNDNSVPYLLNDTYESNTSGTRIINAYNSYNTFSIPVFIQYALTEQRYFSLYLHTGAYVNVIRKYSNSIDGDFNVAYVSGMKQGIHKMNMGLDLFAGLRLVSPGGKYRFFAEPNFRYSFMKNNTSNMINAKYIHQAGLSVGISYNIN